MLRTMEIHIAEEARHISFAHEFLRNHVPRLSRTSRAITSVAFPGAMRWLAGEIMSPPKEFAEEFGIPDEVMKSAFWGARIHAASWVTTSAKCEPWQTNSD